MFESNKTITVAFHDGKFHADDVVTAALIEAAFPDKHVRNTRTRDEAILSKCDAVFDTGMVNDPDHNRFDHHCQEVGTTPETQHADGTPFASTGQCWKWLYENGVRYDFDGILLSEEEYREFYDTIDREVLAGLDAVDNGFMPANLEPVQQTLPMLVSTFNTFENDLQDTYFEKAVDWVSTWLLTKLKNTMCFVREKSRIYSAMKAQGGSPVFVLEEFGPWFEVSLAHFDEFKDYKVCVYRDLSDPSCWRIQTFPDSVECPQKQRCSAPEDLKGYRITADNVVFLGGVPIKFIHKSGFTGGVFTRDRDAAVKAALEWVECTSTMPTEYI